MQMDIKGVYIGDVKDQQTGKDGIRELSTNNLKWTKGEASTDYKPPVFICGHDDAGMRFMLTISFSKLMHRKVREGIMEDS